MPATTSITKAEAVAQLFDAVPAEGLLSRSTLESFFHRTADGVYHSAPGYPERTDCHAGGASVTARVLTALESHCHHCLSSGFLIDGPNSAFYSQVNYRSFIDARTQALGHLELLKAPPLSLEDTHKRYAYPFRFGDEHRMSGFMLMKLPAWRAEYLTLHAEVMRGHRKVIDALPQDEFITSLIDKNYHFDSERERRQGDRTLRRWSLFWVSAPTQTMLTPSGLCNRAGFAGIYSVTRSGRFFFAPGVVADQLNLPRNAHLVYDKLPPAPVLEALDALFEPTGDGPYSDPYAALEAAYRL